MKNKHFRQQLFHVTPLYCYEDAQSDRSVGIIVIVLFFYVCEEFITILVLVGCYASLIDS